MRPTTSPWARVVTAIAALMPVVVAASLGVGAYASDAPVDDVELAISATEPAELAPLPDDSAPESEPAVVEPVAPAAAVSPVQGVTPVEPDQPEGLASTNDPTDPTDPIPPMATVSYPKPPAEAYMGWWDAPVPVTISGTADKPAVIDQIVWSLTGAMTGGGSASGPSTTITIDVQGTTTLEYYVTDSEGRVSDTHTLVFKLDLVAPVISLAAPVEGVRYVAGEEIPIDFTCTDAFMWICYLELVSNGERYGDGEVLVLDEGDHAVRLVIRDLGGREVVIERTVTVASGPDVVGPVVTVVPSRPVPGSGWYNDTVNVTVTATDESAVDRLEFRGATADGWEEWAVLQPGTGATELDGSFQFFHSGEFRYAVRAIDVEGNASEPVPFEVRLDKEILPATVSAPTTLVVGEEFALEYSCDDALSKFASCDSSVGPSGSLLPTGTEGDHSFTVTNTDVAGNSVTTTFTYSVVLDETAPELTATSSATGWTSVDSVDVDFTATDALGVSRLWIEATGADELPGRFVDASSYRYTVTAEGVTTITAYAVDRAGNRSVERTVTVTVDRTAPAIDVLAPQSIPAGLVAAVAQFHQGQSVELRFECTDELSDVVSCEAKDVTGGVLPTDEAGTHSIELVAVDAAGNRTVEELEYTVVAAAGTPAPAPTGLLARTGLDTWLGMLFVAFLFAAGVTVLAASRRR